MTSSSLCVGNWKLRHDEPIALAEEFCVFYPLPRPADAHGRTVVVEVDEVPGLRATLNDGLLPLAIVRQESDGWLVSHLLLRLEEHAFQMIRPPRPINAVIDGRLAEQIRLAFGENHLWLNNFECFYTRPVQEFTGRQAVELASHAAPDRLAQGWHRQLAEGGCAGFRPAFGDEWRSFNYRTLCGRVSSACHDAVALLELSDMRKPAWDSGHAQVWVRTAATHNWSVLERAFAGDVDALLADRIGMRSVDWVEPLSQEAVEVRCEAGASGNLYAVRFEAVAPSAGACSPRYRCELSYLKTLGNATNVDIDGELDALFRFFTKWAVLAGLQPAAAADSRRVYDLHLPAG